MAVEEAEARADWQRRIYQRLPDTSAADRQLELAPPEGVRAVGGVGHIRLSWDPVTGAAGYVIERSEASNGEPGILRHGGSDVAAVPGVDYADTDVSDGVGYRYRVGAVVGAEAPVWSWSAPVTASTSSGEAGPVHVEVDVTSVTGSLRRVWDMVGSERLSQLLLPPGRFPYDIAEEFAAALRLAHRDLGSRSVRAHAILHDDNGVVTRAEDGSLRFDFTRIDAIYDRLLELGLRPVVELSFMPAALARDAAQTVFAYRGIISPPADWEEWHRLVATLTRHLVERYGIAEVSHWAFEVWNEPNLAVFWSGTQEEYFRLYDESAAAVKDVDDRVRVGGPATAAGEWIASLAEHAHLCGSALDFVTTHTYGNLPLDLRPTLTRHGFGGLPVWWTEWGVGSTHFGPVHDGVMGAPFMLSGFAASQERLDSLAYWVVSDHFEELGRPPRLFHNGFGLLTVGNLRKPRFWALYLAAQLGDAVLQTWLEGDGAAVLVDAWATRAEDGTVDVLVWNGTINAALAGGDARLDRRVRLQVSGLPATSHQVWSARVDEHHSNIAALCPPGIDWPDDDLWAQLRAADRLHEEEWDAVTPVQGTATFEFFVPMPGVVRVRLRERETCQ
jgi:xylan 1,4-beta-xylosidase